MRHLNSVFIFLSVYPLSFLVCKYKWKTAHKIFVIKKSHIARDDTKLLTIQESPQRPHSSPQPNFPCLVIAVGCSDVHAEIARLMLIRCDACVLQASCLARARSTRASRTPSVTPSTASTTTRTC